MAAAYTLKKKLTDVEDSAAKFGIGEVQEARFAENELDAEDTGVAYHRLNADRRQAFAHKHNKAEEIYVVLSGSGGQARRRDRRHRCAARNPRGAWGDPHVRGRPRRARAAGVRPTSRWRRRAVLRLVDKTAPAEGGARSRRRDCG